MALGAGRGPEQEEIASWLRTVAPTLEPLYLGAFDLVAERVFPGRVKFVNHAMREIRNQLAENVAGRVKISKRDLTPLLNDLREAWTEAFGPAEGTAREADVGDPNVDSVDRAMSARLAGAVQELVVAHETGTMNARGKAERLFQELGGAPPPRYAVDNWHGATRRAVKLSHVGHATTREEEDGLRGVFTGFEAELLALLRASYENMDELDELLRSAND